MINFENVSFSFADRPVFEGLSLKIPDGPVVVTGPSGFGKTTLLRLAAGLLRPDAGSVTGAPERVSFMFQEDRLLPWLSAEKNVAAALPKHRAGEAERFLQETELFDLQGSLPGELSGGQRRRVALARALAYGGTLILDEPFKGLDPSLTERMAALVLKSGRDVIVTSHSEFETRLIGGAVIRLDDYKKGARR